MGVFPVLKRMKVDETSYLALETIIYNFIIAKSIQVCIMSTIKEHAGRQCTRAMLMVS